MKFSADVWRYYNSPSKCPGLSAREQYDKEMTVGLRQLADEHFLKSIEAGGLAMPIPVIELDPPKISFEPFAMKLEVTDLEQLRCLYEAASRMPSGHGAAMCDFLKGKLARYQRVD